MVSNRELEDQVKALEGQMTELRDEFRAGQGEIRKDLETWKDEMNQFMTRITNLWQLQNPILDTPESSQQATARGGNSAIPEVRATSAAFQHPMTHDDDHDSILEEQGGGLDRGDHRNPRPDNMNPTSAVGELGKSQYAYFLGGEGMCRLKFPEFDEADTLELELKVECAFSDASSQLPYEMGLFSYGHKVYMVGGLDFSDLLIYKPRHNVYVFDPTRFEEFPVKHPEFLDMPKALRNTFKSIVAPLVIRAQNQIYFLTKHRTPWFNSRKHIKCPCFQSFDPTKNRFHILPSPPFLCENKLDSFTASGHLFACGYIYLFIFDGLSSWERGGFIRTFSFNTRSSKWNERKSLVHLFKEKEIPLPLYHSGDTGLSDEFPDNTRILVAISDKMPTAYRVHLDASGSLWPKSYRHLKESYLDDGSRIPARVKLLDIGGGRFCVTYQSDYMPLMIYVFKIDYLLEHKIQNSAITSPTMPSHILCSRKFFDCIPLFGYPSFFAFCLASAPASGNQIAAAEEQDRDGKIDKRIEIYSHKRKRTRSA